MRTIRLKFTIVIIFFLGSTVLFSAPPPPGGGPACWPPPCVPIDGGLVFLIAAGAALGAKKLHASRKKSANIS